MNQFDSKFISARDEWDACNSAYLARHDYTVMVSLGLVVFMVGFAGALGFLLEAFIR